MIQLLFFGLLLHARAADTEEKKKLTQVVVNTTSTEELTNTTSACLRAEFTAEVNRFTTFLHYYHNRSFFVNISVT